MTTRKHFNGKNAETVETFKAEAEEEQEQEQEVAEQEEEQEEEVEQEQEQALIPDQYTAVEIICNDIDDLNVDELKEVIEYCSSRIDELQREEVEALEAEMRVIQDKLMAMRGFRGKPVTNGNQSGHSGAVKRTDRPLANPKNPAQVYTFGKTPDWLSKWMSETGKSVRELRDAQNKVAS